MTKSLFIVGAGPGIGQATAERFGQEGWTIVLGSRSPRTLDPLVASLQSKGINAYGIVVDATDPEAVRAAAREADRRGDGLTAVHYNAAVMRRGDFFAMSDAEIAGDLAVNVAGGLNTIRAAAETFGTRSGTILVTGGGLAITPNQSVASLGLGKAALRNAVQALAPQLAERNIHLAIATVLAVVTPDSVEAKGVANTFWQMATTGGNWEVIYRKEAER